MRLAQATIDTLLERWPVARLATTGDDGRPHQVPVVFARVAGTLWSPIDAKPKADVELVRVRHLRARPAASLLLDEYAEDWSRLWWLRLDVTGRVVGPGDDAAGSAAAVAALRRKYPQYESLAVLREPATLLAFAVERVSSWTAGGAAGV